MWAWPKKVNVNVKKECNEMIYWSTVIDHMVQCVCWLMDVCSWVQLYGDHPKVTNHVERHTHPFKSSSPSVKFLNNNSRQNAQDVVDENNSNHGKLEKKT